MFFIKVIYETLAELWFLETTWMEYNLPHKALTKTMLMTKIAELPRVDQVHPQRGSFGARLYHS